jgi:hypothetical protein
MLRSVIFIVAVAVIIILVNSSAEYRADHDLILRLCQSRKEVIADLRELLKSQKQQGTDKMKDTRSSMIAAKMLFILPQHGGESTEQYLLRSQDYLSRRCNP